MTILIELAHLYERLRKENKAPPPGYSMEKVGGEVVLDAQGNVLAIRRLGGVDDKGRWQPRIMAVPAAFKRTSGVKSNRLWDKTSYSLGLTATQDAEGNPIPTADERTAREHAAFVRWHEDKLAETEDVGLKALLGFVRIWRPDPERSLELAHTPELLDQNLVFRLQGDTDEAGKDRYIHERPAAQALIANDAADDATRAPCLITGEPAPVARLHPAIKGVAGAQSSGASLVSFNLDAFTSYGKEQGENAPVSEHAAFAYGAALNALLARDSGRNLRIGDTTVVFWAEVPEGGKAATIEELMMGALAPDEKAETNRLKALLEDIAKGRATSADFAPQTRIFILGLAPNAARLSVRFWRPGTLGGFARNVTRFWEDLAQEPPAWRGPPAAWSLLYETAVRVNGKPKPDTIPPRLGGDLMQAVLSGAPYPLTLLSAVIGRIRADHDINAHRTAIIAAVLRRNFSKKFKEKIPMSLDRNNPDPAYCLGRLFAAYTYAEHSYTKRSATLRDKYLAGASANPAGIFPLLMRGYEHNRSALLKASDERKSYGIKADKAISEIVELLDGASDLPKSLNLAEQGRFFIGFYHQWNAFFEKPEKAAEAAADATNITETEGTDQ